MSLKSNTVELLSNTFSAVSLRRKSIWSRHGLSMCVVCDDHLCSQFHKAILHCVFCPELSKVGGYFVYHTSDFFITCCVSLFPSFRFLRSCLWMAFWVIQISVCISRIFIATHFPHQVILGLLAGECLRAVTNSVSECYRP